MNTIIDRRTSELLTKWLAKDEIIELIDAGHLKQLMYKTLNLPAFDVSAVKALVMLLLEEGYKLTDIFEKPVVKIPLVEISNTQFDSTQDGKTLSIRYAADVIDDPALNIFLTVVDKIKYNDCKLSLWIYAPDDSRVYPEVIVYCDSLFATKNKVLRDVTDDVDNYIISYYDNSFDDEIVTAYDLDGREITAAEIMEREINAYIDKNWNDIFVNNNYKKLGIEI